MLEGCLDTDTAKVNCELQVLTQHHNCECMTSQHNQYLESCVMLPLKTLEIEIQGLEQAVS